ncbi:hypothetical protein J6590_038790 [Homalodisca vitripennis]|nr:hypothetical protein J6590_038790 [Homalodisca vitripennis]
MVEGPTRHSFVNDNINDVRIKSCRSQVPNQSLVISTKCQFLEGESSKNMTTKSTESSQSDNTKDQKARGLGEGKGLRGRGWFKQTRDVAERLPQTLKCRGSVQRIMKYLSGEGKNSRHT